MDENLLNCPICMDYADNAVETLCCGNVFCEGCISTAYSCPLCRTAGVQYRPSLLARRAIDAIPTDCPFLCGSIISRSDIKTHISLCPNRQFTCPGQDCGHISNKDDMGKHIVQCHNDELIKNMALLFNQQLPPPRYPGPQVDPVGTCTNDNNASCRLGESGKYYCGQAGCNSNGCCDGRCGPTNGCNCASCQRLDLKAKKAPPGYMINRQGALCRPGVTGKFYCGRRVLTYDRDTDGYCGPTDGNQCQACETVQRQIQPGYLYGDVWRDVKPQ